MLAQWRKDWIASRVTLACELNKGACGGTYAEATVILCNVLSAIAAHLWEGRGIDRARFIELLVRYASLTPNCKTVSVDLLIQSLSDKKLVAEMRKDLLPSIDDIKIWGEDKDKSIEELKIAYPALGVKQLKEHTYANILYTRLRSGLIHEYDVGQGVSEYPAIAKDLRQIGKIPYLNVMTLEVINGRHISKRKIHFHISWLSELVLSVANNPALPDDKMPHPKPWWIHSNSLEVTDIL